MAGRRKLNGHSDLSSDYPEHLTWLLPVGHPVRSYINHRLTAMSGLKKLAEQVPLVIGRVLFNPSSVNPFDADTAHRDNNAADAAWAAAYALDHELFTSAQGDETSE